MDKKESSKLLTCKSVPLTLELVEDRLNGISKRHMKEYFISILKSMVVLQMK